MQQFLVYSDLKNNKPKGRISLSKFGLAIVLIIFAIGVGIGGNVLLGEINENRIKGLSEEAVSKLINEGSYKSIEPYVSESFLGELTEEDYDFSAMLLTNLKNSKVQVISQSGNETFGTITPKDESAEDYLFGFSVSLKKSGLYTYEVTNIVTDYGRQSIFDANRE